MDEEMLSLQERNPNMLDNVFIPKKTKNREEHNHLQDNIHVATRPLEMLKRCQ